MSNSRLPRSKFERAHDSFEFDQWPFYNMTRLVALHNRRLDGVLKPLDIDTPRWRVLNILGKYGCATVTKIADEAATLTSTMTKIIRRMIAEGLVVTNASPTDRRSIDVSLTPKGKETLLVAQRRVAEVNTRAFFSVPEERLDALNETTKMIYQNLEY